MTLPDCQAGQPEFSTEISWVGIHNMRFPVKIYQPIEDTFLQFSASVDAVIPLGEAHRGINMSRIPVVLLEYLRENEVLLTSRFREMLPVLAETLESSGALVNLRLDYFVDKRAPQSEIVSPVPVCARLAGVYTGDKTITAVEVGSYYQSLCECSKAISRRGAHNQRSLGRLMVVQENTERVVLFEELVSIVDQCGSAPIFTVVKRPDEKWMTEQAYDNPVFVETAVRRIDQALSQKYSDVAVGHRVKCIHFESIHTHNAVAEIIRGNVPRELCRDSWSVA